MSQVFNGGRALECNEGVGQNTSFLGGLELRGPSKAGPPRVLIFSLSSIYENEFFNMPEKKKFKL